MPGHGDLGTCRACPARIRWVVMHPSGRRNPLNAQPDDDKGNVLIVTTDLLADDLGGVPVGRGVQLAPEDAARYRRAGYRLHLSHFATCPKRGTFGKGGRRRG